MPAPNRNIVHLPQPCVSGSPPLWPMALLSAPGCNKTLLLSRSGGVAGLRRDQPWGSSFQLSLFFQLDYSFRVFQRSFLSTSKKDFFEAPFFEFFFLSFSLLRHRFFGTLCPLVVPLAKVTTSFNSSPQITRQKQQRSIDEKEKRLREERAPEPGRAVLGRTGHLKNT